MNQTYLRRRIRVVCILLLIVLSPAQSETVRNYLGSIEKIVIPVDSEPVMMTVAEAIQETFSGNAQIVTAGPDQAISGKHTLELRISAEVPLGETDMDEAGGAWMYFHIPENGAVQLQVSQRHLLYALFCRIRDNWSGESVSRFAQGRCVKAAFPMIVGEDGFFGTWRRFCEGYDPESAIRETARMGASHVLVNALPTQQAMEDGPAGEIYYRFYQYLPDLDQFVETKLNKGTYPEDYLQRNLDFLKEQAALAVKYGLTPGMHVANPRSVPESLLEKYPYLRGARVDHPYRSYRPRYTLSLAHPLVRWHYATLVKNLLTEIPEIGFLTILINDSGSGFEYTESLYPGRNGGPYLVREWTPDEEIARKAAELIILYYRTLLDAAREINPTFRIHMGLNNIKEEKQIIYDGLSDGLDRLVRTQRMDIQEDRERNLQLEERQSFRIADTTVQGNPYIIGVPSPWKVYDTLVAESAAGTTGMEARYNAPSLAPFDVNRAVFLAYQFEESLDPDAIIYESAVQMAGKAYADELVNIWKLSDKAVRIAPDAPLYGGLGFTWYRFWVRPFVPDIEAIPTSDRAYYEDQMLTIFNNPHNVDFQADALWDIQSLENSRQSVRQYDESVLTLIEQALTRTEQVLDGLVPTGPAYDVFTDLQVRLHAYLCYSRTMRNISAWISGVHGSLEGDSEEIREKALALTRNMVRSELENTRDLLDLWNTAEAVFMPVHTDGEWMHDYGPNFGELLKKKIRLMEDYGDLPPRIDPNYMWRLPNASEVEQAPDVDMSEYIQY